MAKEQLHMAVRKRDTMREVNFNICCEIASWPMLAALSLLMAVRIFPLVVGVKLNSAMPGGELIRDCSIVSKSV